MVSGEHTVRGGQGDHRRFSVEVSFVLPSSFLFVKILSYFLNVTNLNIYLCLSASQVEMSPLENAIEVLENKNQQLKTLISQCQTRQMQNINPLTMCLNGVIDAAVNGGVSRYQEVSISNCCLR